MALTWNCVTGIAHGRATLRDDQASLALLAPIPR